MPQTIVIMECPASQGIHFFNQTSLDIVDFLACRRNLRFQLGNRIEDRYLGSNFPDLPVFLVEDITN